MNRRLTLAWTLGVCLITGLSHGMATWLWSAAEASRAASTERTVVSALADDLAEGNLFRLASTVAKLERDGQLRSARVVSVQDGAATVSFKTVSAHDAAAPIPGDFRCGEPRRVLRHPDGGLSVLTTLPARVAGLDCVAMHFDIDPPPELVLFKNRLLASFLGLTVALLALFTWLAYSWHQRNLSLELRDAELRHEKDIEIGRIAAQVAHDIRSPLAALETGFGDVSRFPAAEREIIVSALDRIREIAESLLARQRSALSGAPPEAAAATAQRLDLLLREVVAEKRAQARSSSGVRVLLEDGDRLQAVEALVHPGEFRRVVSNLINNAVESLPEGRGEVRVAAAAGDADVRVSVRDDGKGIAPELLARLGRRGETHGKPGGTGLGLHHARACVESWGGRLEIASQPGAGTTVTLILPKAAGRPAAVLIDDDALTRKTWELAAAKRGVTLLAFAAPDAFFAAADSIGRDVPVYVDSDLGAGLEGSEAARRAHELGFRDVYMATGHASGRFKDLAYLRGVIGKEPPWPH